MFSTPSLTLTLLSLTVFILILFTASTSAKQSPTSSSTSSNHEMLTRIGLKRVRPPNSHHRKRLAVESRHHSRSDDSHMFVIKLPPNQHYYAHTKPVVEHGKKNSIDGGGGYDGRMPKVPVGFQGNGKPGKIYHWNIPVMKQIAKAKSKSRRSDSRDSPIIDVKYNSWNDVLDKHPISGSSSSSTYKKPSFYVPAKPKKSSFVKYFSGNGKPKSFYVIEKSRKKAHHHRLLQ